MRRNRLAMLMLTLMAATFTTAVRSREHAGIESDVFAVDVHHDAYDRDIAVGVLMQKHGDTVHRLDVEREKVEPNATLIEQLQLTMASLEQKILELQQGGAVDLSRSIPGPPSSSKRGHTHPTPQAIPPSRFESWDVFKNFGTEGTYP